MRSQVPGVPPPTPSPRQVPSAAMSAPVTGRGLLRWVRRLFLGIELANVQRTRHRTMNCPSWSPGDESPVPWPSAELSKLVLLVRPSGPFEEGRPRNEAMGRDLQCRNQTGSVAQHPPSEGHGSGGEAKCGCAFAPFFESLTASMSSLLAC